MVLRRDWVVRRTRLRRRRRWWRRRRANVLDKTEKMLVTLAACRDRFELLVRAAGHRATHGACSGCMNLPQQKPQPGL